jgi:hypothetical protein
VASRAGDGARIRQSPNEYLVIVVELLRWMDFNAKTLVVKVRWTRLG